MALSSLARTLPRWEAWADVAQKTQVLLTANYPFPQVQPKFIGAIVQKFRPRNGRASAAFVGAVGYEPWIPIMEVADFNSLIALSQEHQTPVFALSQAQVQQAGAVWDATRESMATFRAAFEECADIVIALTK